MRGSRGRGRRGPLHDCKSSQEGKRKKKGKSNYRGGSFGFKMTKSDPVKKNPTKSKTKKKKLTKKSLKAGVIKKVKMTKLNCKKRPTIKKKKSN